MELLQTRVEKLQRMSSGKSVKFSGLVASISIKRKPCDLFLNRRAIFFVNLQLELESLLYFRLRPFCVFVWIQLVRRTLYFDVLVVSPLINPRKDQVSRLNSRRISVISHSGMSAPC